MEPIDIVLGGKRGRRKVISLNDYGLSDGIETLVAAGGGIAQIDVENELCVEFWKSIDPENPPVLCLSSNIIQPGKIFFVYPNSMTDTMLCAQIMLIMNRAIHTVNIVLIQHNNGRIEVDMTLTPTPIPG